MIDLLITKLLALTALASGSLLLGLAPLLSPRCTDHTPSLRRLTAQSLALCAGAGVLLATALAHILPELRTQVPQGAEVIFCAGFFLMQFAEEGVHWLRGARCSRREQVGCTAETNESCPLLAASASTPPATAALGLVAALSVHSALEGAAVGVQVTASRVWLLAAAVAAHKLVVALFLGFELRQGFVARTHVVAIAVFAGGCVAGGVAGAVAQASSGGLAWLQALAGGSLLFVAVSEVLPRERARLLGRMSWAGLAQLTATVAGFALALVVRRWLTRVQETLYQTEETEMVHPAGFQFSGKSANVVYRSTLSPYPLLACDSHRGTKSLSVFLMPTK